MLSIIILLLLLITILLYAYQQNRQQIRLLKKELDKQKLMFAQAEENKDLSETRINNLQKLNELRKKLFINMAHELRTPLGLMLNPLKNLKAENTISDEKTLRMLQKTLVAGEHLSTMIRQILELSKINLGQTLTKTYQFKLQTFLLYINNKYRDLMSYRLIDFKIYAPNEDPTLFTDARKLETILSNLISNAIKHTPPKGSIALKVKLLENAIQFTIIDTGKGIPADKLHKIFSAYYQIEQETIIPEGGIGIGLTICKEYAASLEGTIEAESKIREGSKFILTIPQQLSFPSSNHPIPHFIFPELLFKSSTAFNLAKIKTNESCN